MEENQNTSLGIQPNIEAMLSYIGGWITGLVFFTLEKKSMFVRFHAVQSILTLFLILSYIPFLVLISAVSWLISGNPYFIPGIIFILVLLLPVFNLMFKLLLMYKAYRGKKYKFPLIGLLAEKLISEPEIKR